MKPKYGNLKFEYFQRGDYVITGYGVGIVVEDEAEIKTVKDFYYSEIKIKHKEGCSENPGNEIVEIERELLSKITKEQYMEY